MFRPRLWLLVLLMLAPAALRLIDHPWNMAPIAALALFAGAYFRDKVWAFAVPLGAMCLSDVAIGLHELWPNPHRLHAFIIAPTFPNWTRSLGSPRPSITRSKPFLRMTLPARQGVQ